MNNKTESIIAAKLNKWLSIHHPDNDYMQQCSVAIGNSDLSGYVRVLNLIGSKEKTVFVTKLNEILKEVSRWKD